MTFNSLLPNYKARISQRLLRRFVRLSIAGAMAVAIIPSATASAAQAPVGLGTATSFAILAGAGITNTGATTVTGDIGTYATTSETGFGTLVQTGVNHAGDAVTQQAKLNLVSAFNDAVSRGPATATVPVDLAGQTLTPGVYNNGTFALSGALTLDAQGDPNAVFVFQAATTLITSSASTMTVINGGASTACNVVWTVGSSATLGSASQFIGTILASTSITLGTAATVQGRALAQTGSVTMNNNTITNTGCAVVAPTPTTTTSTTTTVASTTTTTPATTVPASSSAVKKSSSKPSTGTPIAATGSNNEIALFGMAMLVLGMICVGLAARGRVGSNRNTQR